jgi:mono/diheme cytochrome c family protein
MDTAAAPRFTLRQLPLPAKLVVTLFLLTVGLGYFSALVQMHFQHTQADGTPMPGVNDVIEIFAGKRKIPVAEARAMQPQSKLESVIRGSKDVFTSASMSAAFFHKDPTKEWDKLVGKNPDPAVKAKVEGDREGERQAVLMWIQTPDAERKAAYETDVFKPAKDSPPSITEKFQVTKGTIAAGVKIQSILTARCAECHQEGGVKGEFPLDTYTGLAKYLEAPPGIEIPEGATEVWCASSRQIGREKLAQSTHAHLLSFAMLFSLTGLAFAFTSHRAWVRFIIAPLALLAQVADVSCWWLARIDGPGVYFAQAIMATGAVVGMSLGAQIVLSVFNMYGVKGKFVLVLLFVGGAAGLGFVGEKYAKPYLLEQKAKKEKEAADAEAAKKKPEAPKPPPAVEPKKVDNNGGPSKLERAFTGKRDPMNWVKNGVVPEGGMILAFFDKESDFKAALKESKDDPETFKKLLAERETEHAAALAWVRTKGDERKKAFDTDKFPLPADLKGKPFTADFFADDKSVKIKSMFEARCSSCHGAGTTIELETYENFEKFLK